MAQLLSLDQSRRNRELANADLAEEGERRWSRAWMGVYLQCLGLMVSGYLMFGLSWSLGSNDSRMISTGAMVAAYVLPFFRLVAFFLRNADQF